LPRPDEKPKTVNPNRYSNNTPKPVFGHQKFNNSPNRRRGHNSLSAPFRFVERMIMNAKSHSCVSCGITTAKSGTFKDFINPATEMGSRFVLTCKGEETKMGTATQREKDLRQTPNPAEQSMWVVLKARGLGGYKFVRQVPIGPYFADFVCRERGVVIEVDGSQHLQRAAYDRARDEYMLAAGYSVYRVPMGSVLNDRVAVCHSILAVLEGRIEDFVEAPNLNFIRSFAATPIPRGFSSSYAKWRQS
jgi:very-short-patch-repair endonuclease